MSWCSDVNGRLAAKGRKRKLRSFGLIETASSAIADGQATLDARVVCLRCCVPVNESKLARTKAEVCVAVRLCNASEFCATPAKCCLGPSQW